MNISLDEFPSIKGIHIMKNNELIVNVHRDNVLQTQAFPVGCVFKSFLSILMGIAIKERIINSIEDSVLYLTIILPVFHILKLINVS